MYLALLNLWFDLAVWAKGDKRRQKVLVLTSKNGRFYEYLSTNHKSPTFPEILLALKGYDILLL